MNRLWPTRRILLEAVVLVTVAAAAGLSFNYTVVMKAFSGRSPVAPPAAPGPNPPSAEFPSPVELDEIDGLLAEGYRLVDARAAESYAEGHLPGALSLPLGEVETRLPQLRAQLPLDTPLITYCNGFGCPDSFDLGVRLLAAGYKRVLVYEGGFPEWRDSGRPLVKGETP